MGCVSMGSPGEREDTGRTRLNDDEAGTGRVSASKVDAALVVGDVETLDSSLGSADEAGEGREDERLHDSVFFFCCLEDDEWKTGEPGQMIEKAGSPETFLYLDFPLCPTISPSQSGTDLNGRCRWSISLESLHQDVSLPHVRQRAWLNDKVADGDLQGLFLMVAENKSCFFS